MHQLIDKAGIAHTAFDAGEITRNNKQRLFAVFERRRQQCCHQTVLFGSLAKTKIVNHELEGFIHGKCR
ncbi:hypothetical protein D3C86_1714680 [compost metagenome]